MPTSLEHPARPSEDDVDVATQLLQLTGSSYSEAERADVLGALAYFVRYGYILGSRETAANSLMGAPWLGADAGEQLTAINRLVGLGLLNEGAATSLLGMAPPALRPSTRTPVVQLSRLHSNPNTAAILKVAWARCDHDIATRLALVSVRGWSTGTSALEEAIKDVLEKLKTEALSDATLLEEDITVSIVSFHGTTWFDAADTPNRIEHLAREFDVLRLKWKILVMSPNADGSLLEGGSRATHRNASRNGLIRLARVRGPYDVRSYGLSPREGLFRGVVIKRGEKVVRVEGVVWRFVRERATYGVLLDVDGRSGLGLLLAAHVDSVFRVASPVGSFQRRTWYYCRLLSPLIVGVVIYVVGVVLEEVKGMRGVSHLAILPLLALVHESRAITAIKRWVLGMKTLWE